MASRTLQQILLNVKSSEIIAALGEEDGLCVSELTEVVEAKRQFVSRRLAQFQEHNVVELEENGRKKICSLTEEGSEIAEALNELFEQLEKPSPQDSLEAVREQVASRG